MAHRLVEETIRLIQDDKIPEATDVFVEYYKDNVLETYKKYSLFKKSNTVVDQSLINNIKYNIQTLEAAIAGNNNEELDTIKELIRISYMNLAPFMKNNAPLAGTKRPRNNSNKGKTAKRARFNTKENTLVHPYTGKVRFPTPSQYKEIGTLKINRRGVHITNNTTANVQVAEPPAKDPKTNKKTGRPTKTTKPGWTGWVELPNSPVAASASASASASAPLAPLNRFGQKIGVSNDPALKGMKPGKHYEPPNQVLPGLTSNNNSNNNSENNIDENPYRSACPPGYVPGPFPWTLPEAVPTLSSGRLTPLLPVNNRRPGLFTLNGPPLPAAPAAGLRSPGFRPGPGNTPKTVNELRNLGFRGGKKRTAHRKRSTRRSTRRFAHRKH